MRAAWRGDVVTPFLLGMACGIVAATAVLVANYLSWYVGRRTFWVRLKMGEG